MNSSMATAMQHLRRGEFALAEKMLRQFAQREPNSIEAWYHLGMACLSQGKLDDSIAAFNRILAIEPNFPEALNNLGVVLARGGKRDEAIDYFCRAALARPQWAEPLLSLGNLYAVSNRHQDSIASYEAAIQSEPGNAEPHNLLGAVLAKQGFGDRAFAHFSEAIRLNPHHTEAHSNLLLSMNYDPARSPLELLAEHRLWDRLHGQGLSSIDAHENDRDPDRVLRVGYVSSDFRTHAAANFILPIFDSHDPSRVQCFAYYGSRREDAVTERLRVRSAGWYSTVGRSDAEVADKIRSDEIDILVDLAGHTAGNRLGVLTRRPAPVQISYLGYPSTTGLTSVQYRLTDEINDPPGSEAFYCEELVRLPRPWCCYQPNESAPGVEGLPAAKSGAITFGSLHNLAKLNDRVIDLWSRLLERIPGSQLLVLRNTLDEFAQERLRAAFSLRGISPDRLALCADSTDGTSHLSMYHRIDILLDGFPWSGHATTCESLWMGVPVITLLGARHASRMSGSILSALGLNEFIAQTPEEFVELAVKWHGELEALATLRAGLRERVRTSPLCDSSAFACGLEEAYRGLWRRWCSTPIPT